MALDRAWRAAPLQVRRYSGARHGFDNPALATLVQTPRAPCNTTRRPNRPRGTGRWSSSVGTFSRSIQPIAHAEGGPRPGSNL